MDHIQHFRERLLRRRFGVEAILSLPSPPAEVRIMYGTASSQFGDLRLPPQSGPHPVVMVIHGGFWRSKYDLQHIGRLCAAITWLGAATWSIEYRRLGNPGGGWPGTFADAAKALEYLRTIASRYDLDLNRVVVMGHSAGGHLALWLAGLHRLPPESSLASREPLRVSAAISLAGVSDLRRAWELGLSSRIMDQFIGSPEMFPERYAAASPIELLPIGGRQWLLHGVDDDIVPYELSQRYYEKAHTQGDPIVLIPLAATGHFELIDPESKAWPQVREIVLDLLGSSNP